MCSLLAGLGYKLNQNGVAELNYIDKSYVSELGLSFLRNRIADYVE